MKILATLAATFMLVASVTAQVNTTITSNVINARDALYVPRYADTPGTGRRGNMVLKYTTNQLYIRNGASTAWVLINGGGGGGGGSYLAGNGVYLDGSTFKLGGSITQDIELAGSGVEAFSVKNIYQAELATERATISMDSDKINLSTDGGADIITRGDSIAIGGGKMNMNAALLRMGNIAGVGAGKVLTSDENGYATWQPVSGGGGSSYTGSVGIYKIGNDFRWGGDLGADDVNLEGNSSNAVTIKKINDFLVEVKNNKLHLSMDDGPFTLEAAAEMSLTAGSSATMSVGGSSLNMYGNSTNFAGDAVNINTALLRMDNLVGKGVGKVLTSDVDGYATWQAPAGGSDSSILKYDNYMRGNRLIDGNNKTMYWGWGVDSAHNFKEHYVNTNHGFGFYDTDGGSFTNLNRTMNMSGLGKGQFSFVDSVRFTSPKTTIISDSVKLLTNKFTLGNTLGNYITLNSDGIEMTHGQPIKLASKDSLVLTGELVQIQHKGSGITIKADVLPTMDTTWKAVVIGAGNQIRKLPYWPSSGGGADSTTYQTKFRTDSSRSNIYTLINAKANDTGVVHKGGAETLTGIKTFSTAPIFSDIAAGRFLYTSTGGQVTQNLSLTSDGTRVIVAGASTTNSSSYDLCVSSIFGNGKAGFNNRMTLSNTIDGGMSYYLINTATAKWGWSSSTNDVKNNISTVNMVLSSNGLQVGSTAAVDASAVLELNSTTRGLLLPRMTSTQMAAIGSPAAGLLLTNTTTKRLAEYNSGNWNQHAEVLVATVTGINGLTGTTNLFTVPTSNKFVVTKVMLRVTNSTGVSANPEWNLQWGSGSTFYLRAYSSTILQTNNNLQLTGGNAGEAGVGIIGQAGEVLKLNTPTDGTGTTLSIEADVFGYYVQ